MTGAAIQEPNNALPIQVDTTMSASIGKLAAALAKAQGLMRGAKKESVNPFFQDLQKGKSGKYADLESVWDACREPLAKNELAVFQPTEPNPDGVTVITLLVHSSGEWMRGKLTMRPEKPGAQAVGVCISYARRYALAAMVGVYQMDDDAEAATNRTEKKNEKKEPITVMGAVMEVFTKQVPGENEDADTTDYVFVRIGNEKKNYLCFASVEPNRSKLLDTEGKKLELVVMPYKANAKNEMTYMVNTVMPA